MNDMGIKIVAVVTALLFIVWAEYEARKIKEV